MNILTTNVQLTGKLGRGQRPGAETRTEGPCEAIPLFALPILRPHAPTTLPTRVVQSVGFFLSFLSPPKQSTSNGYMLHGPKFINHQKKKGIRAKHFETAIFVFTKNRSTQNLLVFLSPRTISPQQNVQSNFCIKSRLTKGPVFCFTIINSNSYTCNDII
jgi:hypothetical protein